MKLLLFAIIVSFSSFNGAEDELLDESPRSYCKVDVDSSSNTGYCTGNIINGSICLGIVGLDVSYHGRVCEGTGWY